MWQEFRIRLRGPIPLRPRRGSADHRHPVSRRRNLAQALRCQQPRTRPDESQCRRRRTDAARDLSGRLRIRRQDRGPDDGHVLVQQDQRCVLEPEPLAAHRGTPRTVGLRRPRRFGLGSGQRPRGGTRRGPRPGNAADRNRYPDRRRRARRRPGRISAHHCRRAPGDAGGTHRRRAHRRPHVRRRASPRTGTDRCSGVRCLAGQRRRTAAADPRRANRRGDRRIRVQPAVPGSRQFTGGPDQARQCLGRDPRPRRRRPRHFRTGLHLRRHSGRRHGHRGCRRRTPRRRRGAVPRTTVRHGIRRIRPNRHRTAG